MLLVLYKRCFGAVVLPCSFGFRPLFISSGCLASQVFTVFLISSRVWFCFVGFWRVQGCAVVVVVGIAGGSVASLVLLVGDPIPYSLAAAVCSIRCRPLQRVLESTGCLCRPWFPRSMLR
ncbi:hypothetical protein U1Q18_024771 [Sarracenia purpurea var. burkii]